MATERSDPIRALVLADSEYPAALLDLRDAPPVVYVRGQIPPRSRTVAIVGSRAASDYGRTMATRLARELCGLGFAVVSGLARGIDAAAHEGALEVGGTTVAVLPGGLDAIAPRHHTRLAERIAERGGLISEWASGAPRGRSVFVQRNRLIAALASAVIVVEADERSGALSTANAARRLGRTLLAVPGDVDRPTAAGCLALLRGGARLCANAGDVVACLPSVGEAPSTRLLAALDREPLPLERLAKSAAIPAPEALALLLELQWAGAAEPCAGQRWRRRERSA